MVQAMKVDQVDALLGAEPLSFSPKGIQLTTNAYVREADWEGVRGRGAVEGAGKHPTGTHRPRPGSRAAPHARPTPASAARSPA